MPSNTERYNNNLFCLHMNKADSGSEQLAGLSHKLNPGQFIILRTVFRSSPDLTHRQTTHCLLHHFFTNPAHHIQHELHSLGVQITNPSLLRLASFATSAIVRHDFSSSRLVPLDLYIHVVEGAAATSSSSSSPPRWVSALIEVESYEALCNCAVCLEEMSPRESKVVRIPCSHMFHRDCIVKWLGICLKCPICRHELPI